MEGASTPTAIQQIPVDANIEDFTKCICDLKIPCLIDYKGKISQEEISKYLQDKFKNKSIKVFFERVLNDVFCVKINLQPCYKDGRCWLINSYKHHCIADGSADLLMSLSSQTAFDRIFNSWYSILPNTTPPEIISPKSPPLTEKYLCLYKKINGSFALSTDYDGFYPNIDTMKYIVRSADHCFALKVIFDPKIDLLIYPAQKKTEPSKFDLVVNSLNKDNKDEPRVFDMSKMSKCPDGYIEKFIYLEKVNTNCYETTTTLFLSSDDTKEQIYNHLNSSLYFLKIMFRLEDIINFTPVPKKYYLEV